MNRRDFLKDAAAAAAASAACAWAPGHASPAEGDRKTNVLFIGVDDLRPWLGCYGERWIQSPNIDALAARGVVFRHAYCQNAVCNPARTCLLTGRRPDTTRIFDNGTHFREYIPDVTTLPQHFKNHGWHTQAVGKIYHSSFKQAYVADWLDDPPSWSALSWFPDPQYYYTPDGINTAREVYSRSPDCGIGTDKAICIHNRYQKLAPNREEFLEYLGDDEWKRHFIQGIVSEAPDIPDDEPMDGRIAARAIQALQSLKDRPFFLAVGFMKPHSPYVAPRKYWDIYDPATITLVQDAAPPKGAPPHALLDLHDHAPYSGAPESGPLDDASARHLMHGYAACVSFLDAQIGKVLDELNRLGLAESTHIVLWSDHGYHLGENSRWGKQTCYETSTRVPLIVASPALRKPGTGTDALVEHVDVFPTLCELAGLPLPEGLEGYSFAPLLADPLRPWRPAVFSQFPRPLRSSAPGKTAQPDDLMGYTMRTESHRIVVWRRVLPPHDIQFVELYDYHDSPIERINVADDPAYQTVLNDLLERAAAGWQAAGPPA